MPVFICLQCTVEEALRQMEGNFDRHFPLREQIKHTPPWFSHALTLWHFKKKTSRHVSAVCFEFLAVWSHLMLMLLCRADSSLMEKLTHTVMNAGWHTFNIQSSLEKHRNTNGFKSWFYQCLSVWLTHWWYVWLGSFVIRCRSQVCVVPDHIKLSYSAPITLDYCGVGHSTVNNTTERSSEWYWGKEGRYKN